MRRRRPEKRSINPDPKFNDLQSIKVYELLISRMEKKVLLKKFLYDAFDIVKEKRQKIQLIFSKSFK